jgi:hypothetical protein
MNDVTRLRVRTRSRGTTQASGSRPDIPNRIATAVTCTVVGEVQERWWTRLYELIQKANVGQSQGSQEMQKQGKLWAQVALILMGLLTIAGALLLFTSGSDGSSPRYSIPYSALAPMGVIAGIVLIILAIRAMRRRN